MGETTRMKQGGSSSHAKTKPSYKTFQQLFQMHPDVQHALRFMAPWEGPTGSIDNDIWGMSRYYTEDELAKKLGVKSL